MNSHIQKLSATARQAARARDWARTKACAWEILHRQRNSAEGRYLLGIAERATGRWESAVKAFSAAVDLDTSRHDAAVELAELYMELGQFNGAVDLLARFEPGMRESPRYLGKAARIYINVGLPDAALPLLRRAVELQPEADVLQADLAECLVFVGEIDDAATIYRALLEKHPDHQRNNYELSRLRRAKDTSHIEKMLGALARSQRPPGGNVFLYYALGKEYEDLERWDEAFEYYKKGGDAARSQLEYDVRDDIAVIDRVIEVCDADWLGEPAERRMGEPGGKTPIFIVGLPRSGTTLTERILTCHSKVQSIGESYFVREAVREASRVRSPDRMNTAIIDAAARCDIEVIAKSYLGAIEYKLGDKPFFVEKFPENVVYLGFIAKAFPDCRIVLQTRNPMDSCFALYKQSYFRYAYSLDDLGAYYVAHHRLVNHWRETFGDRLVEVSYESMVSNNDKETRILLERLGLEFEEACLHFEKNVTATNTASTVQVREKAHTRSVRRWTRFEKQLQSLKEHLERAGIDVA